MASYRPRNVPDAEVNSAHTNHDGLVAGRSAVIVQPSQAEAARPHTGDLSARGVKERFALDLCPGLVQVRNTANLTLLTKRYPMSLGPDRLVCAPSGQ